MSFSPLDYSLSGSALKVIAILSMVSDHIAYFFLNQDSPCYEEMRCFGRIAFPVFAFLIAEGFAHTRNRQRYCFTLLGFAIISEIPWLLHSGYTAGHNVMFTLALGVLSLQALDKLSNQKILAFSIIAFYSYIAERYNLDYGWRGVCMIVVFYIFRYKADAILKRLACGTNSSTMSSFYPMLVSLLPILQVSYAFPLMAHYGVFGAALACMVILMYNGKRGFVKGNVAKYAFYAFYPAHLFVIWLFIMAQRLM